MSIPIQANGTGGQRVATVAAGGQNLTLTQRSTSSYFNDVAPDHFAFEAVNLLRTRGITGGTSVNPPLYSPDNQITRGQMAVFIIRTIFGGDTFDFPATPYFTDVPAAHGFFKWIQKMKELGITAGTSATTYSPDDPLTRGQMAVFVIRARYGPTAVFNYSGAARFTDVPPTYPYYSWIQKMGDAGITAGCGAGVYCPGDAVTRGQMAIFVMRGGFNQLLAANAPVIAQVSPASVTRGQQMTLTVTAANTNFTSATQVVVSGAGMTVGTPVVASGGSLSVTVSVAADAPLVPRSVTAITGAEEATLPNGLAVR